MGNVSITYKKCNFSGWLGDEFFKGVVCIGYLLTSCIINRFVTRMGDIIFKK